MAKGIYERKGQHGDVTYYIRYEHQGKDKKERVGRKSQGFTREVAKKALNSRLGDIAQGVFKLPKEEKPVPFSSLVDRYEEYAKANWRAFQNSSYILKEFRAYFKETPLSKLTSWDLEKWKASQKKTDKPATVNRHLTILKHMLKKAVEWKLAKENPGTEVKCINVNNERNRYLEEDEMERLLSACKTQTERPWLVLIVILAIHTGMRLGELVGLRWNNNVDLNHWRITLVQGKNQKKKTIPLNDAAREVLELLYSHRYGQYVFMYRWGEPLGKRNVQVAFDEVCKAATITDLNFHDLRHTFASYLVMSGVDLTTVSRLMGHSSTRMTERYTHLAPKHEEEAVAKLNTQLTKTTRLAQNRNVGQAKLLKIEGISPHWLKDVSGSAVIFLAQS